MKVEWNPRWNFVRERHVSPGICRKGTYRTVPSKASGVTVLTCCRKGEHRTKKGRCCDKSTCRSTVVQALRFTPDAYRKYHPDRWAQLQRAKPDGKGTRVVRFGRTVRFRSKP